MATRDRTALFIQYRASFGKSAHSTARAARTGLQDGTLMDDRASLLPHGSSSPAKSGDHTIEMVQLPPRWMDIVDEIDEDFKDIKEKIQQVDAMHKKQLLPGFDDSLEDEEAIERLYTDITRALQTAGKKIKKIAEETSQSSSTNEQTMGRNIQTSLATKLQELSTQFRKSQTSYLKKIQGRETRGQELYQGFAGSASVADNENNTAPEFDLGFNEQKLGLIYETDKAIDQRSKEIMDIVKSINELAEIFRDMQTLVIDQGTILDRIDYNIEQVAVSLKTANKELVAGEKYQKKAQARYCIIGLGLLIVILLIIVIIKPR